jgi:hypothetical protein
MHRIASTLATAVLVVLCACDASVTTTGPLAAGRASLDKGGNSDAAHLCHQDGWTSLQRADGTLFSNVGDCVSYAAQGGTPTPIPQLPVITSFVFDGFSSGQPVFTAIFSNGTAFISDDCGSKTPVVSGVATQFVNWTGNDFFTLVVTNGQGTATQNLPIGNIVCS